MSDLPDRPAALTFCIPFYRGLDYLEEALRSVLAQTSPDWRCLVVDDTGPEPEARERVAALADARITYVRNPANLGLAGNWNRCLELATTPLVTLLHADDRLRPDYAARMLVMAAEHPQVAAFFCRAAIIDAEGRPALSMADRFKDLLMPSMRQTVLLDGEDGLTRLMRGNFVFCPSLCYRRERLRQPVFDASWRMVLDLDWLARMLLDGGRLVGSPATSYEYRRHGGNQTSILTRSMVRFDEEIALQRQLADRCRKRGWLRAAAAADMMMSVRLHLLYQTAASLMRRNPRRAASFAGALFASMRRPHDGQTPRV